MFCYGLAIIIKPSQRQYYVNLYGLPLFSILPDSDSPNMLRRSVVEVPAYLPGTPPFSLGTRRRRRL